MALIRRNPLLAGFNTDLGLSPGVIAAQKHRAFVAANRPAPAAVAAAAVKAAAPTPAQVATAHREKARPAQVLKPRIENYGDQATLSQQAKAEAQDRLTVAAMEYEVMYGGGQGAQTLPTGPTGSGYGDNYQPEGIPLMNPTAKARAAFITWLRDSSPEAYRFAMERAYSNGLSDTAPASTGFDWKKFLDAATAATTAVFQTKAQKDMLKVNIERAKAGLPPMDTSFAAPVIRTQFDVSPEIAAQLQQTAQAATMNVALVAGAGLLAFMLLRRR